MSSLYTQFKNLSFNQKATLIIITLGLIVSITFNILQYNQNSKLQNQINVNSYGQSGGITAGQVNIGAVTRHVDNQFGQQLEQMLNSISAKGVNIMTVVPNGEPAIFGKEIQNYLQEKGWDVNYQPAQIFGTEPIVGVVIDPKLDEKGYAKLTVGSAPENNK